MRKVALGTIGAVTLLLAGMLTGNAEAAPLTGCCHRNGAWMCGMACEVLRKGLLFRGVWQMALPLSSATPLAICRKANV